MVTFPSCSDGRMTKSIEKLRKVVDGHKNFADNWTTSRRSCPMMMIGKLDRCERNSISSPPRKLSQVFDKNKDDRTSIFRRTREHDKDHSMKRCEQTWIGTARIGKLTGLKLPLHHLHNNGGNTNTKTLNGEINIGGNSDGYRLFQSHVDFCFHRFRVQTLPNVVHATAREDRTPRRTHIFQCRAHFDHHTHLRVAQGLTAHVWDVLHLCAS